MCSINVPNVVSIQSLYFYVRSSSAAALLHSRAEANEEQLMPNVKETGEDKPQDFLISSHFSSNDLIMVNRVLAPKKVGALTSSIPL